MKNRNLGRREFLKKTTAAAVAFTIIPRHVLGEGFTAPSDQLTKGIIGVGGMGMGHIDYEGTRLLAVCDVDKTPSRSGSGAARGKFRLSRFQGTYSPS